MDEAKMSDMKNSDVDPWLMDGCLPNDPSLLKGLVLSQEVEDAIDALYEEMFGSGEAVPSAA